MKMKKILVWSILILSGFYVGAVTGVILVDLWAPQSIAPVRGYILLGLYALPLIAELLLPDRPRCAGCWSGRCRF